MGQRFMNAAKLTSLCVLIPALAAAQGRGGWYSFGGDAQRTGWNPAETDLALDNIKGLKLEWSIKLNITPRALSGLTVPIARINMSTARGIKDFIIVGGASDQLYEVDGDDGKVLWEKTSRSLASRNAARLGRAQTPRTRRRSSVRLRFLVGRVRGAVKPYTLWRAMDDCTLLAF